MISYTIWKTAATLLPNSIQRSQYSATLGRYIYQSFIQQQLIVANDNRNQRPQQQSLLLFDSYDDEAFQNQSSIDVLISIYESATLGASLQLTGEQSRFLPDFIGPTLMAMWYDTIVCNTSTGSNGLSISCETYFLDSTYRPNPKGKVIYILSPVKPHVAPRL